MPHEAIPDADLPVARALATVARALAAPQDLDGTMAVVCGLARSTIEGCDHAAVSLATRGRVTTRGASDPVPELVDGIQYELGEGPCLDAVAGTDRVDVEDLVLERRWPRFAPRAVAESPVRAMMAFRLEDDERTMGALNLYSDRPGGMGTGSLAAEIGALYAAHATVALVAARRQANLTEALSARSTISLAVGILMARQQVGESEAFEMLRRASQRTNTKLRDLAHDLAQRVSSAQPATPPRHPE